MPAGAPSHTSNRQLQVQCSVPPRHLIIMQGWETQAASLLYSCYMACNTVKPEMLAAIIFSVFPNSHLLAAIILGSGYWSGSQISKII